MSSTSDSAERRLNLSWAEKLWSLNYDVFLRRGYRLRERFRDGAIAEFMDAGEKVQSLSEAQALCKDAVDRGILDLADDDTLTSKGIDATRISDGAQVWIKRCKFALSGNSGTPSELALNLSLTAQPAAENHCLPLLEYFDDQSEAALQLTRNEPCVFLVFPLELQAHQVPWRLAAEAIEFVRQLIEGLLFLHRNNIAHGDIHTNNILVDTRSIFPHGFDPRRTSITYIHFEDPSPTVDRIEVPIKYFYIDLGLSTRFDSSDHHVTWRAGVHKLPEVFGTTNPTPEALDDPPQSVYDAFAADVWQLGTTLHLLFGKSIPSLPPLLRAMTERQPEKRPTADECLARFHALTDGLSRWELLWPVLDASGWRYAQPRKRVLEHDCYHFREWARLVMKAIRLGLCKPEQMKRLAKCNHT